MQVTKEHMVKGREKYFVQNNVLMKEMKPQGEWPKKVSENNIKQK